ncbi:MAG: AAA family ATPase [Thiomonas sp.]
MQLDFLDFSALEVRRRACEDELRLNRRLAPTIYLDVVPIHGSAAAPRLGGEGDPIEYVLRMKQFAAGALFSERLAAGSLDSQSIDRLSARLAAFHDAAPVAADVTPYGNSQWIRAVAAKVLADLDAQSREIRLIGLRHWCEEQGARLDSCFEARKRQGWIREGHGDLHLANVVVLDDTATAFDCMEFDPGLRWIDVQCDIAFLTMDLTARGRRDLAFRFLDGWLEGTGDIAGLAVLRYYEVYRALIRALVAGIRRGQGLDAVGPDYIGVALGLAVPGAARLLITHGLSGSGKSELSKRLLEVAGAVRLRSDVERKRLFGLHALDDSSALVRDGIYAPSTTQRTYARLRELAATALDAGYPVIVDATFLRAQEREAFRSLARAKEVPFAILDCRADPAVLHERVRARSRRADDASEADLAVLERQLVDCEPLRADERCDCIDVDTTLPLDVDAIAQRWLRLR